MKRKKIKKDDYWREVEVMETNANSPKKLSEKMVSWSLAADANCLHILLPNRRGVALPMSIIENMVQISQRIRWRR